MKKSLLTIVLAGFITLSFAAIANSATITVQKPSIKVNTTQEEDAYNKLKNDVKRDVEKTKSDIKKAQNDAKEKQAQQKKEARAKKEQRAKALDNFRNETNINR